MTVKLSGPLGPKEYLTIEAGLIAATFESDKLCIVKAGTYTGVNNGRNINWPKVSGIILSGEGASITTIDAQNNSWIFTFEAAVSAEIKGITISNATTTENGGAFRLCAGTTLELNNSVVSNCRGNQGGAFYCENNTNVRVNAKNCIFSGNNAVLTFEAVVNGIWNLTNCSFFQLVSDKMFANGKIYAKNCIFWGGSDQFYNLQAGSTLEYCDIEYASEFSEFSSTKECLAVDPKYLDSGAGDLRLAPLSPCIDKGTNEGATPTAIDGITRPKGMGYDMGAYEQMRTDIYVSPTGSDETGSGASTSPVKTIQYALTQVATGGVINLLAGLYTGEVDATHRNRNISWPNRNNITLKGAGSATTTVDAESLNRLFNFTNVVSATIEGITLRQGNISTNGGCIYISASQVYLRIKDAIIKDNRAAAAEYGYAYGGAVYCVNNTDTIEAENCKFEGNSASAMNDMAAGGMAYQGTWKVKNSTFTSNEASGGFFSGGIAAGGIWTVSGSTFNNNKAYAGGVSTGGDWTVADSVFKYSGMWGDHGGVANGGVWRVTGSTFEANVVDKGSVAYNSTWTVDRCTFRDNGGAGGQGGVAYGGTFNVKNSVFSGHRKASQGGISNGGTWTVTNCAFSDNGRGLGGVAMNSIWNVTNSTFYNNTVEATGSGEVSFGGSWKAKNSIFWGGSNQFYNTSCTIEYCDVQGGWGNLITGVGTISADPLFVSTNESSSNFLKIKITSPCLDSGTKEGAPSTDYAENPRPASANNPVDMGFYEYPGTPPVHNKNQGIDYFVIQTALNNANPGDTITLEAGTYIEHDIKWPNTDNIILRGAGPGVSIISAEAKGGVFTFEAGVRATIEGLTITKGYANNIPGNMCLAAGCTLDLINVTVSSNESNYSNGCIVYCPDDLVSVNVMNSIFFNNRGSYTNAGIGFRGTWKVYNSQFYGNSNDTAGIAYYGTWEATNSVFSGNAGESTGIFQIVNCTVKNCIFNNTYSNGGAGVASGSRLNAVNSTFYRNNGTGPMDVTSNCTVEAKNSIFWGSDTQFNNSTGTLEYCDIQGGWGGLITKECISADPLFLSTSESSIYFMKLANDSPCLNTGTFEGATPTAKDGTLRPQPPNPPLNQLYYDMGAYEQTKLQLLVYVSDSRGDDISGTGSSNAPYKTIQKGLGNVLAGGLVSVEAGLYTGEVDSARRNRNISWPNTDNITLRGAGSNESIISAEAIGRVFNFAYAVSATIESLTVRDGNVSGYGAGMDLKINGVTLELNSVNFYNNVATQNGGAINCTSNPGNNITVNNCTFRKNSADSGGVAASGKWKVTNSSFYENSAAIGGVSVQFSSWEVKNSIFSKNISSNGSVADHCDWDVTNCTFNGNIGNGGTARNSDWKIKNSIFWGHDNQFDGVTGTIEYCDVQNSDWAEFNTTKECISSNPLFVSTDDSSPDFLRLKMSSPCIDAGTLETGVPTRDAAGNPRPNPATAFADMGAYEYQGTPKVHNPSKGTDYFTIQAALNDADVNNTITLDANTVYLEHDILWPNKNNIILLGVSRETTIISAEGKGRVFKINNAVSATIESLTVKDGNLSYDLGACFNLASGVTLSLNKVTVTGNRVDHGSSGAVYCTNESVNVNVKGCIFSGNRATPGSGGVGYSGIWNVQDSIISGNSGDNGGVADHGRWTVANSIINNNSASSGGICYSSIWSVKNSTFYNNIAALVSTFEVKNSIFWGSGDQLHITCTGTIEYSDVYGSWGGLTTGVGTISADPLFIDADGGNFMLLSTSECINSGTFEGAPPTAIDGESRPLPPYPGKKYYDMGAYEQNGPTHVHNQTRGTDYITIQEGLNDAQTGNIITLDAFTFNEHNINWPTWEGIILRGAGSELTTIDAQSLGRIISIETAVNLTIEGVTLKRGNLASQNGGALWIKSGANVELINARFASNEAVNGGVAYCENETAAVKASNCIFESNNATNGEGDSYGAVAYRGNWTVYNCLFYNNYTNADETGYGGVACLGQWQASNSIFWANTAQDGNVFKTVSPLTVKYSDIQTNGFVAGTGNISSDPLFINASGGNFRMPPTSPCINSGTFEGAPEWDITGTVHRPQPTFDAYANFDMGVYEQAGLPKLDMVYVSTAGSDVTGTGTKEAPLKTIQMGLNTVNSGGTVSVEAGLYTGEASSISRNRNIVWPNRNNITLHGAGSNETTISAEAKARVISFEAAVSATIEGLTIMGGSAEGKANGGGMYLAAGVTLELNSVNIKNNKTVPLDTFGHGGAIYCADSTVNVKVNGSAFSNNSSWYGGAAGNGTWTVTNSAFSGNHGEEGAGVAYYGIWNATNSTFSGNSVSGSGIGGVAYYGTWTVNNCIFNGNSKTGSAGDGGAVAYTSTWYVNNSIFNGNTSSQKAGVAYSGTWTVTNCAFSGNTSNSPGCIAFQSNWNVINCTFNGNGGGAEPAVDGGLWHTVNSIFWGNIKPFKNLNSSSTIKYCDVQGTIEGFTSTECKSADPLFISTTYGTSDYLRLGSGSPCIDTASIEAPTPDLAGKVRPRGLGNDMGAYEFQGPSLRVLQPNGGEQISAESTPYNIMYVTSAETINSLTVRLSTNEGSSWDHLITSESVNVKHTAGVSTYEWTPNSTMVSPTCLISVEVSGESSAIRNLDASNATFEITAPPPLSLVYVSTAGSDTTGSGSYGNPYRSIRKGIGRVTSGGTVEAFPGTYIDPQHAQITIDKNLNLTSTTGISTDVVISGEGSGGGYRIFSITGNANVYISRLTITKGCAYQIDGSSGGGIWLTSGSLTMEYVQAMNCQSNSYSGGGGFLCIESGQYAEVNNCLFQNNSASDNNDGGAIWNSLGYLYANNNIFNNNTANDSGGGAIYSSGPRTIYCNNNIFKNNSSKIGAAIGCSSGAGFNGNNNIFYKNNAAQHGGAIALSITEHVEGKNNVFIDNSAVSNGGAVYISQTGAGNWYKSTNDIYYRNSAASGTEIYEEEVGGDHVRVAYSCMPAGNAGCFNCTFTSGSGNTTAEPLFISTSESNANFLKLGAGSPCIDTASKEAPSLDLAGKARPRGFGNDMGVYEFGGPSIRVLKPNGGEMIVKGNKYRIMWQTSAEATNPVNVRLSTNEGATWDWPLTTEAWPHPAGVSTFEWTPLISHLSSQCLISVEVSGESSAIWNIDKSDAIFEVVPVSLLVFVSTTGSDETGDGTSGSPYRTIQKGLDNVAAGGTVSVDEGLYTGEASPPASRNRNIKWPNVNNITLRGAGSNETFISAEASGRGISFEAGVSATIEGLTIQDGYVYSVNGGGIYLPSGSTLEVKNINFKYNTATGTGNGGAIYCEGPLAGAVRVKASNCGFIGNKSGYDGGAGYQGTWTIDKCVFDGNSTLTMNGAVLASGVWNITDSVFKNNQSGNDGGVAGNGTMVAINSIFSNNWGRLGGVAIGSTCEVINCTFSSNDAGISSRGDIGDGGTWTIKNSIFWNNDYPFNALTGANTIEYSDLQNPIWTKFTTSRECISADPLFGSTSESSSDYLRPKLGSPCIDTGTNEGALKDIEGTDRPQPAGGRSDMGIYEYSGTPKVHNETLGRLYFTINAALNDASLGNLITMEEGTYLEHGIIWPNTANITLHGAGPGLTTVDAQSLGRVISFESAVRATIEALTLRNGNTLSLSLSTGGALCLNSGVTLELININAISNEANDGGFAYCIDNTAQLNVKNSFFAGNKAIGGSGGVAFMGRWSIANSTFEGNGAGGSGVASGGIWTAINSRFSNNYAIGESGIANNGTWTASNCIFNNNTASGPGGIAHLGTWEVTNCTFYNNSSEAGGRGDIGDGGTWRIKNSIFWNNDYPFYGLTGANTIEYSDVQNPSWEVFTTSTECRSVDPLFIDAAGENFLMLNTSECINTGTFEGAPEWDITGTVHRPQPTFDAYVNYDMGAYEQIGRFLDIVYVSNNNGSDEAGEGTAAKPYKTIQKGLQWVNPGGLVSVEAGLYTGEATPPASRNRNIKWPNTANITLRGAGPGWTTVDAQGQGRIISIEASVTATIEDMTIRNGVVSGKDGGGILLSNGSLFLDNVFGLSCSAEWTGDGAYGGFLCVYPGTTARTSNCVFRDNYAVDGGAVFVGQNSSYYSNNDIFENNRCRGAVFLHTTGSKGEIRNSTFRKNYATGPSGYDTSGPALTLGTGSQCTAESCVFTGNRANENGGAVICFGTFYGYNNIYISNEAFDGGAFNQYQNGYCQEINSVYINNRAASKGGAVFIYQRSYYGKNNIFYNNNASTGECIYNDSGLALVTYSCKPGGNSGCYNFNFEIGAGNITSNPLFISTIEGTTDFLKMLPTSECVNFGTFEGAPATDITGVTTRPQPANSYDPKRYFDMGIYEQSGTLGGIGPTVTVEAPATGEALRGGIIYPITWTATDDATPSENLVLHIYYASSEGWEFLATTIESTSGYGTYEWTVPSGWSSKEVKIRVQATDEAANVGTGESGAFAVDNDIPLITITHPVTNEMITAETSYNITWNSSDPTTTVETVTIRLSTDEGMTWGTLITQDAINKETYSWFVSNFVTNEAIISIEAKDKAGNVGMTNSGTFEITPSTGVTRPSTLEIEKSGSNIKLKWQSNVMVDVYALDPSTGNYYDYNSVSWTKIASNFGPTEWEDTSAGGVTQRYYRVATANTTDYSLDENGSYEAVGKFDISLNEGWTMASIPLAISSLSIQDVIGTSLQGANDFNSALSDQIWYWDSDASTYVPACLNIMSGYLNNKWVSLYDFDNGDLIESNIQFTPGRGSWLFTVGSGYDWTYPKPY